VSADGCGSGGRPVPGRAFPWTPCARRR
jgi:hypothetical protein